MTPDVELRHLRRGPDPGEQPGGLGIVRFDAQCPGCAEAVLDRCQEVLELILKHSSREWPSLEVWETILPEWFVGKCAPEISQEEAERELESWRALSHEERVRMESEISWPLSHWLYWFEPPQRHWFWWDALVENEDLLRIAVEVKEWPFPWRSLDWLVRASGATTLEPEE